MASRSRYSRWDGTQDPWADADDLLEELSDELLESGDLQHALRRMMQRGLKSGTRSISGLQSLMERLRSMRRRELAAYDVDSVVSGIEDALRDVRNLERSEVQDRMRLPPSRGASADPRADAPSRDDRPDEDDPLAALEREMATPPFGTKMEPRLDWLDRLEGRPADAIRQMQTYDFLSPEAEAKFNELVDSLRRQMMQQFFRGAEQALQNMSAGDVARMKQMLSELNDMLRKHAAGEPYDFDRFMQRYGDFFPENPQSLAELLESLARRMAAAQAMLQSMTPEMRARLEGLMESLAGDAQLQSLMSDLESSLRQLMPGRMWDPQFRFGGDDPLELMEAMQLLERLQEADDLERYLRQVTRPGDLDEIDTHRLEGLLGPEAVQDLERLRRIERMLEEAGYVQRHAGRLDLTARGVRRIGMQALGQVYRRLRGALAGEHDVARAGYGGELTGELKQYEFGDPFHVDVKQTIFEAVRRAGGGTPVRVQPADFQVERTEHRVRAATALLVDLSLSMPMRGNWVAAKKVALALHALVTTMYPRDVLYIVGFSDYARQLQPTELPGLGWEEVYGTNLQHALIIARRLLGRHSQAARNVLLVTDGEPTAHLRPDGEAEFAYPPVPRTITLTLSEAARCAREGIVVNTFMLDRSPDLVRFVQRLTQVNRGRAFFTSPEHLGEYVLFDFLESKRTMLHGA